MDLYSSCFLSYQLNSVVVYFSISGVTYIDGWEEQKVAVYHSGLVFQSLYGLFQTSCKANVYKFPFDKQMCAISLVNRISSAFYTNFTLLANPINVNNYLEDKEWTLQSTTATEEQRGDYSFRFSLINFVFILERQSRAYVVTMILPIILLSLVGLMVFPLPPDSGERVSLNVACLMSFFINQIVISEQFPSSWDALPIIGK